jgi:hypothetical protein
MIHPDALKGIHDTFSQSWGYQHHWLQEPLIFTSMGSTFVCDSFVRGTLQIGSGAYYFTFFVAPDLPVDAIMGNGSVIGLGVRFNHHRRTLHLKLTPNALAPGCEQPVNSKGESMSCQWVPMCCEVHRYPLW